MSASRFFILLLICFYAFFKAEAQVRLILDPETGQPVSEAQVRERNDSPLRPSALAHRFPWINEYQPDLAEKKLLSVAPEDERRYRQYLLQPGAGLFRLFPHQRHSQVVSVTDLEAGKRLGFNSYAATYSFSKNRHGHGLTGMIDPRLGWAELAFKDGMLVSGFTNESLGLLVKLGDVPLVTVTPNASGVAELSGFAPPVNYSAALAARKRNLTGYEKNKFTYRSLLPATVNTTYALRVTSYGRADVLVAFRVIRQDNNGSLTILWKKLGDYQKPVLKGRPKQQSLQH